MMYICNIILTDKTSQLICGFTMGMDLKHQENYNAKNSVSNYNCG